MFSIDMTDQRFVSGGNGKEVEAVDRKWRETAAYQDEQFLNIEERLVELEEEVEKWEGRFKMLTEDSEKRLVLFSSAIKEEFRNVEKEGEKREARIKKLEEERERKEALLCFALEEMVSLKNRGLLQEKKNAAAAGKLKEKRGWMIPTAVILAVAGITAVVVKSWYRGAR